MYLPTAGFEIAETDRYSGSMKREACIIATKEWHVGDEIRHCSGTLVSLTTEEERALEGGRDFSIMWSSRKDTMCLLLGPARFVNHDCCPNTEFISSGQNAIAFKFLRDVAIGEELTAYYGDNYFGAGNEEFLKEGLRPFVYDDKGKLIRLTKSSKNKQLDKQIEKPLQPTTDIDCATNNITQHSATTTISLPTRAEPMNNTNYHSFSANQRSVTNPTINSLSIIPSDLQTDVPQSSILTSVSENQHNSDILQNLSSSPSMKRTANTCFNSEMENSWAGVNVVASPEIRVEWGITIFRRVNTPIHQGVNAPLSNNFGVTGQSNSPFTPAGGSSRMSIAYLCSNDISDSSSKAIVIAGPSSTVNAQQEITRLRLITKKEDAQDARVTLTYSVLNGLCARCLTKSLPEPEPSGEWEPFSAPGFIVNTIRYNGKDCIPSIAYEYNYQGETIRWDALTGFVHMNPIKKLMGNPNFKIEKLSCYQPSWNDDKFVIVGGNIKYQGTFPYHNARKVIAEVLGLDNQGFVPIFGPGYRSNDRRPVIVVSRGHVLTDDSSSTSSESDDDVIMSDVEVEVRSC
ncbi:19494_t:CDS:2 [Racocetra fulgida]|uniref:19494_t:CDS:1 n=1 Tax=Racocetra fulgida TaxID=60492 RepID=A0A9N9AEK1_9GLOM|nr:19494_t:CDS:2 [Racocetra fulgida]